MQMNKIQLFKHQVQALYKTKDFNKVAYYLDMGLGKTFVGSEKLMQFGTNVNLLVCQKSKIDDWRNHFAEFYKYDISAYDLTKKKQWDDFWNNPVGFRYQIGIINYELAWRRKDLLNLADFTLMLDESSMIQNESAKRSKFILKMNPKNVILLSGTPTAGKYENLYTQIHLLGWNISKDLYWKQYIETEWVEQEGFFRKDVIGYKNVERLKAKLAEHGAIFMKTNDAGVELPERVQIQLKVPTTKEYKQFMRKRIVTVEGKELVGDTSLTKRLYARMLCGQYNKAKLEAFKDLVQSTEDRLIVFYNFTEEMNLMKEIVIELEKPTSIISGEEKDLTNYECCGNSITFVQYQAGAMGLNLQKANKTVYFTLPQSSELFDQSHSRTHRIGQAQTCFYYYMMCVDSVEEDILDTLNMRKDYTDELFKKYEKEKKR